MRMLVIASALSLMVPAPIAAEQPRQAKDPNQIVCKSQTRKNSRFMDRTCRTRAEWQVIEEAAKRDAKEMIDKPSPNYCDGGGCPGGGSA
jgi:hypothetical protein